MPCFFSYLSLSARSSAAVISSPLQSDSFSRCFISFVPEFILNEFYLAVEGRVSAAAEGIAALHAVFKRYCVVKVGIEQGIGSPGIPLSEARRGRCRVLCSGGQAFRRFCMRARNGLPFPTR